MLGGFCAPALALTLVCVSISFIHSRNTITHSEHAARRRRAHDTHDTHGTHATPSSPSYASSSLCGFAPAPAQNPPRTSHKTQCKVPPSQSHTRTWVYRESPPHIAVSSVHHPHTGRPVSHFPQRRTDGAVL